MSFVVVVKSDFQNLQSEPKLGYTPQAAPGPRDKAIGLTWGAQGSEPAKPTVNLAQRNPDRKAPRDAYFNTEDPNLIARRFAGIDAHEALGHGEDPMLSTLLQMFQIWAERMPDDDPNKKRKLTQLMAAIESPGITMEELTNEVLDPEGGLTDPSLSERVRQNFAQRANEPGAMFGFGSATLDADQAKDSMAGADSTRREIIDAINWEDPSMKPKHSSFGKAWTVIKYWVEDFE